MPILEICIDTAAGLRAAIAGGADRVELCSALELGGLTPHAGLMALAATSGIRARAMIRPRAGNFLFNDDEIDQMLADIAAARAYPLEGLVLGASLPDGRLDRQTLSRLVDASRGAKLSLHRAFDLVPDIEEAVELAVELGFDTILTSGRAATSPEGLADIALANSIANGRITIMAGGGVNIQTIGAILSAVPLQAVHSSASVPAPSEAASITALGFATNRRLTDASLVAELERAIS